MENRLEDYSFQRWGNSYVKGVGPKGGKIYGFREIYKTKVGDFSPEEWRKTVRQAIEDIGEAELLEEIKKHCRENCAWLRKETDIEEYSMECLVDRAYLHWKDFKGGLQMAEERAEQVEVVENAPAKMEFRLINPTEKGFLKHIEWNKAELEAAVRAKVAEYSGVAYTEETLRLAKNDRAELNKLLSAIEERRKRVKEIINQPYADFEKELKEVTALISEQMAEIDSQVKVFEDQQKEEKRKKIKAAYDETIGELAGVLPFEKVFNQRFLNKTYKLETAVAEVKQKIEKVRTDLSTIDCVCGKYKLNAKDVYVRTLDLSKALAEEKRLKELEEKMEADRIRKEREAEARRKAEEERKRRAEEARKAEEARLEEERRKAEERRAAEAERQQALKQEQNQETVAEPAVSVSNQPESVSNHAESVPEAQRTEHKQETVIDPFAQKEEKPQPVKKVRTKFYAVGTMEQLKQLVAYMKENGIKYGKVD